jgi:hypothetical protein
VDAPQDSRLQLSARFLEERRDDPRQRMRVELVAEVTPPPAP